MNAAGTFVTLLCLHLLNNSQQWGYHYSNLKAMTEREERGKKLLLEVRLTKQLLVGQASRYVLKYHRAACSKQIRQWVEICWTSIHSQIALLFQGCDSQCSKQNLWKSRCRANLSRNCWQLCFLGKKTTDPKDALETIFQFLLLL